MSKKNKVVQSEVGLELLQKALERLVEKWKPILEFSDWEFKVEITPYFNLPNGAGATCDWSIKKKNALIRVIRPEDYPAEAWRPMDPEELVVHEMSHVLVADVVSRGNVDEELEERLVENITRALLRVDRNGKH